MKKAAIREALECVGATIREAGRAGWVVSDCPLGPWRHKDGKSSSEVFGVKIGNGDPFCNCFACDFHGTMGDLFVQIKMLETNSPSGKTYDFKTAMGLVIAAEDEFELDLDTPDVEDLFILNKKKDNTEYDEWFIKSFPSIMQVDWAQEYWTVERGMPIAMAQEMDIRVDTGEGRVCFPVKDFHGKYRGLHGRAIDPDKEPRWKMYQYKGTNNPIVWLGENWVDSERPIVVCEGPFDMVSILRVYDNVVCPLFANPNVAKLKRMAHCFSWVTMYDQGTGGEHGRERVTEYMGGDHVIRHVVPPAHRKDPGEMTVDELLEALDGLVALKA